MSETYPVILFYKYVPIRNAAAFAADQRALCSSLELKGRILIASEGVNGTLAGPAEAVDRYVAFLKADARFSDIEIKVSAGDAGTFPKLVVKVRSEIVTLNAGAITPDKDNQLSPAKWKRMMEENPNAVPLDIRNRFESDAGKFENAVACDIEHFRELPQSRSYEEEMSAEPWFSVRPNDIFPEEFPRFLAFPEPARVALMERHGDLFRPAYWRGVQEELRAGHLPEILPYVEERRLRVPGAGPEAT